MGTILMIVGGGLCGLSVLVLLSMVATVVWDGERQRALTGAPAEAPRHEASPAKPRKRRNRMRRLLPNTSWAGAFVLALALAGLLGSTVWVVGYFLDAAGSRQDVDALVRSLQDTSGRHVGGRGGP